MDTTKDYPELKHQRLGVAHEDNFILFHNFAFKMFYVGTDIFSTIIYWTATLYMIFFYQNYWMIFFSTLFGALFCYFAIKKLQNRAYFNEMTLYLLLFHDPEHNWNEKPTEEN